ncbi:hypothetical protein ACFQ1E_16590 [Sphingomonas canadensis]|uniref:Uncharacterized protein n=1 Tax=Sphingomonas canadensis TaxID=1219257 RepID=A0ABW3H957_9SPHN|nr:hypothetical protein [Sphingomonas canadensis]MCW3837665.1 hypothetical protein [Sphingomonas canadensis]
MRGDQTILDWVAPKLVELSSNMSHVASGYAAGSDADTEDTGFSES